MAKAKEEIKELKEKQERALLKGENDGDMCVCKAKHDEILRQMQKSLDEKMPNQYIQELIRGLEVIPLPIANSLCAEAAAATGGWP